MLILIDTKNWQMVAAAKNRNHIHLIAWVDMPELSEDFTVVDSEEKRTWSIIGGADMETLYKNMSGEDAPSYSQCIADLSEYAKSWEPYGRSEESLQAEYDKRPLDTSKPTKAGPIHHSYSDLHGGAKAEGARVISGDEAKAAKAQPKGEKAATGAPRKAGATKQVWDIADGIVEIINRSNTGEPINIKNLRASVIDSCVKAGINPGTAATQFAKWKADKGL